MKLTRKLIPAMIMLLVSAVLMSTASFAWFSMNQNVTATGIQITADAPESLMISTTDATTGFSAAVALANKNTLDANINPTTYNSGSFFELTESASAFVNEDGQLTGTALSAPVEAGDYYRNATTTDVFTDDLWLKLEGTTETKNLQVKVEWAEEPTQAIKSAFHVLFVVDGAVALNVDMGTLSSDPQSLATQIIGNGAAVAITVHFYLDGTDTDCKNSNISADTLAKVNLTFSYT